MGLVKLEEDKLYTSFDDIKVEPGKVEPCPNFIFMPSKLQIMKLIMKSAHFVGMVVPKYNPPSQVKI